MKSTKHPTRRPPLVVLALAACILLFSGCTTVPKNGALLSAKLTEGIQRNQSETEKIITALADTQRAILSDNWEIIYAKVERGYREINGLGADAALDDTQRSEVAAVAAKTYYDLRAVIAAKEDELKGATRANAAQLVEINETVQKYLLSVEKLDASRNAVLDKLQKVAGIDFSSITGLAGQLLAPFQPPQP